MKISESSPCDLAVTCLELVEKNVSANYFEDLAQNFCEQFYQKYSDSIVLTRIFITRPYSSLPADVSDFTNNLAKKVGVRDQIKDISPILSLAGTKGRERAWSDRKTSDGHKGIPLVSSEFVSAVPMLMGLFTQVFGDLRWLDFQNYEEFKKITGKTSGSFYVKDAHVDVDTQNRKIIAAQDFVKAENVRSVLGLAGGLLGGSMIAMLNFLSEEVSEQYIEGLMPAMASLRANALKKCLSDNIFRPV